MRKCLLTLTALLHLVCVFTPPAIAQVVGLTQESKQIKWLNLPVARIACTTCPNDTIYGGFSSTRICTTMVVPMNDVSPVNMKAAASDSIKAYFGRFAFVSDSTAAGSVTVATVTIQAVYAGRDFGLDATPPAVIPIFSQAYVIPTGKFVITVPFVVPGSQPTEGSVSDVQQGASLGMGYPAIRAIVITTTGSMGQVRCTFTHYKGAAGL